MAKKSPREKMRDGHFHPKARTDICPHCKTHFKRKLVKLYWKDCVECQRCGFFWVLYDFEEYRKWC